MKNNLIVTVIVAVVVGSGAFFGGMKYQESQRANSGRQFANGQPGGRGGFQGSGNRSGFRPVTGDIISSDDKSITVKLADGGSKIVFLSDKTEINKADKAVKEDLKVGEKVAVFGQENSDGSVTAQNVQLNPRFSEMRNNLPSPSPTP